MSRCIVSLQQRRGTKVLILVAPVVKEVKPNWHTKLFNGTFLHENAYRQSAGPEVDAAWEALGVNCEFFKHSQVLNLG